MSSSYRKQPANATRPGPTRGDGGRLAVDARSSRTCRLAVAVAVAVPVPVPVPVPAIVPAWVPAPRQAGPENGTNSRVSRPSAHSTIQYPLSFVPSWFPRKREQQRLVTSSMFRYGVLV